MATTVLKALATGGLAISTADQLVDPNTWQILDNADLRAAGSIRKLPGYNELSNTTTTGGTITPVQLAYRLDELVCWTDDDLFYRYVTDLSAWQLVGQWTRCDLTLQTLAPLRGSQDECDGDAIGDLVCTAWIDQLSSDTFASIVDVSTGATILAPTLVDADTCTNPRVVAADDYWSLLWRDSTDRLLGRRILLSAPTALVAGTVTLDPPPGSGSGYYDAVADTDNTVVVARDTGAGLRLIRCSREITLTTALHASVTNDVVSVVVADGVPVVSGFDASAGVVEVSTYDYDLNLQASAIQAPSTTSAVGAARARSDRSASDRDLRAHAPIGRDTLVRPPASPIGSATREVRSDRPVLGVWSG